MASITIKKSILHRKTSGNWSVPSKSTSTLRLQEKTTKTVPKDTSIKKIQKTRVLKTKTLQVPAKKSTILDLVKAKAIQEKKRKIQNEKALFQTWYNLEILRYAETECDDDILDESEEDPFAEDTTELGDSTDQESEDEYQDQRRNS